MFWKGTCNEIVKQAYLNNCKMKSAEQFQDLFSLKSTFKDRGMQPIYMYLHLVPPFR